MGYLSSPEARLVSRHTRFLAAIAALAVGALEEVLRSSIGLDPADAKS